MIKRLLIGLLFLAPVLAGAEGLKYDWQGGDVQQLAGNMTFIGGRNRGVLAPVVSGGGGGSGWVNLGRVVDDQTKTGSDPYDVMVDTTVEVGNVIVCAAAVDNDGDGTDTNDWTGLSDSAGNTWTTAKENEVDPGAASAGAVVEIGWAKITTQLTAGLTISFNLAASKNSKAAVCYEFSAGVVSSTGTALSEDAIGADAGPLTMDSIPNLEHLFVRAVASETGLTETITPTSGWTGFDVGTTGSTDNTNMRVYIEFIIATASSKQSDPTFSAPSIDRASALIALDQS